MTSQARQDQRPDRSGSIKGGALSRRRMTGLPTPKRSGSELLPRGRRGRSAAMGGAPILLLPWSGKPLGRSVPDRQPTRDRLSRAIASGHSRNASADGWNVRVRTPTIGDSVGIAGPTTRLAIIPCIRRLRFGTVLHPARILSPIDSALLSPRGRQPIPGGRNLARQRVAVTSIPESSSPFRNGEQRRRSCLHPFHTCILRSPLRRTIDSVFNRRRPPVPVESMVSQPRGADRSP